VLINDKTKIPSGNKKISIVNLSATESLLFLCKNITEKSSLSRFSHHFQKKNYYKNMRCSWLSEHKEQTNELFVQVGTQGKHQADREFMNFEKSKSL
jgi:hypothetical protein